MSFESLHKVDEVWHDNEIECPVEDVKSDEQNGKHVSGSSVEVQFELRQLCLQQGEFSSSTSQSYFLCTINTIFIYFFKKEISQNFD